MRLPWVSRTAYELLLDERDRLRAKADAWEDHSRRVTRSQQGLTELPAGRKKAHEPLPSSLSRIISKFDSEHTRQGLRNSARLAHHREGKAWSEIQAELEHSVG
jgi:anti-sigma-K factor RskA|tara:strand:- start:182 stop:493 length:312 start_codon:yes stop_codon:yes gene_type:complete